MLKKIGNSLGFIVSLITLIILLFKKDDKDCVNELKEKVNAVDKKTTAGLLKIDDVSVINSNIGHLVDDINDLKNEQSREISALTFKVNNLVDMFGSLEFMNVINKDLLEKVNNISGRLNAMSNGISSDEFSALSGDVSEIKRMFDDYITPR